MAITEEALNPAVSRSVVSILRQIHRWIAVVLAVFMLTIGITGTILQFIIAIYGEPIPPPGGGPPLYSNMPPLVASIQQVTFGIHTAHYIGALGAWYGVICGLGLLFFSISGLWMYLALHRARGSMGRQGLFWRTKIGTDATVRSLHRWFAVALVLFTTMLSFTGGSLDLDFGRNGMTPPGGGGGPGGPRGGGPGGPPGGGQPSGAAWHELNFTIHKIDFLGSFGHWLGVVIGLGLTTFAITGICMYFSMHARRAKAGQKGVFW